MSASAEVFCLRGYRSGYLCSARPNGRGPQGIGDTLEEAQENLQSLWRDMGMVPWEPGRNLIEGGHAQVIDGRCLIPALSANQADKIIKQIMENSR